MEHGWGSGGWGAGIFWLFIAAAVVANSWERIRKNAEKHETLRRIIEKTGTVDEAKLNALFKPSPPSLEGARVPGGGYRALRIGGTIVISLAAAMALFASGAGAAGAIPRHVQFGLLTWAGAIAILGAGLFVSSRFAEQPAPRGNEPPAR